MVSQTMLSDDETSPQAQTTPSPRGSTPDAASARKTQAKEATHSQQRWLPRGGDGWYRRGAVVAVGRSEASCDTRREATAESDTKCGKADEKGAARGTKRKHASERLAAPVSLTSWLTLSSKGAPRAASVSAPHNTVATNAHRPKTLEKREKRPTASTPKTTGTTLDSKHRAPVLFAQESPLVAAGTLSGVWHPRRPLRTETDNLGFPSDPSLAERSRGKHRVPVATIRPSSTSQTEYESETTDDSFSRRASVCETAKQNAIHIKNEDDDGDSSDTTRSPLLPSPLYMMTSGDRDVRAHQCDCDKIATALAAHSARLVRLHAVAKALCRQLELALEDVGETLQSLTDSDCHRTDERAAKRHV